MNFINEELNGFQPELHSRALSPARSHMLILVFLILLGHFLPYATPRLSSSPLLDSLRFISFLITESSSPALIFTEYSTAVWDIGPVHPSLFDSAGTGRPSCLLSLILTAPYHHLFLSVLVPVPNSPSHPSDLSSPLSPHTCNTHTHTYAHTILIDHIRNLLLIL